MNINPEEFTNIDPAPSADEYTTYEVIPEPDLNNNTGIMNFIKNNKCCFIIIAVILGLELLRDKK